MLIKINLTEKGNEINTREWNSRLELHAYSIIRANYRNNKIVDYFMKSSFKRDLLSSLCGSYSKDVVVEGVGKHFKTISIKLDLKKIRKNIDKG